VLVVTRDFGRHLSNYQYKNVISFSIYNTLTKLKKYISNWSYTYQPKVNYNNSQRANYQIITQRFFTLSNLSSYCVYFLTPDYEFGLLLILKSPAPSQFLLN